MKIVSWAGRLLLAVPFLAGCAGFWQTPSSSSGGGTTTSTLSSGVFYVLDQTTMQIAAYSISSGSLVSVSGSPYTLPAIPYAMALSPNKSFLYVSTQAGIYVYGIGSGGALTEVAAVSDDTTAYALAVDTSGSWLLDASQAGYLYAIPISSSTGQNTSTTVQAVAISGIGTENVGVQQIAVSPDDGYVFVTAGTSGTAVVPFSSGNGDPFGTPMNIGVKGSGGAAVSVAVDPSSRLFYIGETAAISATTNTGGVRVFNYSTFSELSGSPYASGGLAPYAILPKSDGEYLYVANRTVSGSSNGNITGFTVTSSSTTYTLTALSTSVTAGYYPVSLAEDADDNYLLVANYGQGTSSGGNPDLAGYNFDTTTAGQLDYVISSSTGTDPVSAIQVLAVR